MSGELLLDSNIVIALFAGDSAVQGGNCRRRIRVSSIRTGGRSLLPVYRFFLAPFEREGKSLNSIMCCIETVFQS